MIQKPRVFVSAPYSALFADGIEKNVSTALNAGMNLFLLGYIPFVPHLYHYWDKQHPSSYETWMELCLAWLPTCDAFLRLPGDSPGADREEAAAVKLGIPVFHNFEDLRAWKDEIDRLSERLGRKRCAFCNCFTVAEHATCDQCGTFFVEESPTS